MKSKTLKSMISSNFGLCSKDNKYTEIKLPLFLLHSFMFVGHNVIYRSSMVLPNSRYHTHKKKKSVQMMIYIAYKPHCYIN